VTPMDSTVLVDQSLRVAVTPTDPDRVRKADRQKCEGAEEQIDENGDTHNQSCGRLTGKEEN
jgi:hypothetical protein